MPAAPEPLITCVIAGVAEFQERELDRARVTRQVQRCDLFVTGSQVPYEVRWSSPLGEELDVIVIHLALDQFLAALEAVYPGKIDQVEVVDYFGRNEVLAHLCLACAEILATHVPRNTRSVATLTQLLDR